MRTLKDLTNLRFGKWLVVEESERSSSGGRNWLCECDCGKRSVVDQGNLKAGKSSKCKSCASREANLEHGMGVQSKGLYSVWKSMKSRCLNPNRKSYSRYGGRGITICDTWQTFEGFLSDMGSTYQEGLTLDRINNDGNYELSNCRWATAIEQGSNTSKNVRIEFEGSLYTEAELHRLTKVPRTTLQARRRRGLVGEDIVYGFERV